jgi:hypothetical protein
VKQIFGIDGSVDFVPEPRDLPRAVVAEAKPRTLADELRGESDVESIAAGLYRRYSSFDHAEAEAIENRRVFAVDTHGYDFWNAVYLKLRELRHK